jgi:hypothetical protein
MRTIYRFAAIICMGILVALLAPTILSAADVTPKPTMATVFKTDGTSIRGAIESADPDQVVIKPAPKPGHKDDAESVTIPWKQIKSVSNGITQAKLLQAWKVEHKDDLCPTCHGDRTVMCPTCKGTGHDPASGKDCPTCKGELLVNCKTPKCKDGMIPCPNPNCLKLTDGTWTKHPDGLRWRRFNTTHGYDEYSEHHLGEVILRSKDGSSWEDTGKCPICGGTTTIEDPACHGTGKIPCPTCVARKDAPPCPDHCDNGRVVCPDCGGTGLKKT